MKNYIYFYKIKKNEENIKINKLKIFNILFFKFQLKMISVCQNDSSRPQRLGLVYIDMVYRP